MIDGIKQLGEQLSKIKEQIFAKRDKPEVEADLDAYAPIDSEKEIRAAKQNNMQYGRDPEML